MGSGPRLSVSGAWVRTCPRGLSGPTSGAPSPGSRGVAAAHEYYYCISGFGGRVTTTGSVPGSSFCAWAWAIGFHGVELVSTCQY